MSSGTEYKEVPQKDEVDKEPVKPNGYGIRHLQIFCMWMTIITLFVVRSSMAVAILSMTDTKNANNSNVQIFDWDKKTQGLVLSSFFWGYVIMQLPAGALSKRYGGKPMLEVALIVNGLVCVATPLFASVGGWHLVCATRVIMGLSQACTFPSMNTLLGKWLPASERTKYVGIVLGGTSIGIIIAMPLSGVLADTAMGWKTIFYSMGALCFIVAIMWHFLSASSPRQHRWMKDDERKFIEYGMNISADHTKVQRTPWKEIMTSRGLFSIMISQIACTVLFVLFFTDLPTFLEKGLHISLKNSATISALPHVGAFVVSLIASFISQTLLNKKILSVLVVRKLFTSIGLFGGAIGLVMLSFMGPETKEWAVISLVFSMSCQGFLAGGFAGNYFDISPNFAGLMLSIVNLFSNTGSIFTPILISFILRNDPTDVSRWRIVFLIFAVQIVIANVIYLFMATTEQAPWDDPDYFNKKDKTIDIKITEERNTELHNFSTQTKDTLNKTANLRSRNLQCKKKNEKPKKTSV